MSKQRTTIYFEDLCYVLVRIDKIHPIAYKRHDLLWYPERGMSLLDTVLYQPYVKSIVTENPWLISAYGQEYVRVWDYEHGWIRPRNQTYGASVNHITMTLLGIRQTISSQAYDGGEEIQKLISKLSSERP